MLRRNPSAAVVQDFTILEAKDIDACCHPVDLEKAECSNSSESMKLTNRFHVAVKMTSRKRTKKWHTRR